MEVLPLLLVFFIVSGYSYKLQPRLSFMQKAELDTDQLSEMKSASSVMERKDEDKNTATVEEWSDLVSPESNPEEGGLTPETKLPVKCKTQQKNEDEIRRNVEQSLEGNQERGKASEEGLSGVITGEVTGRADTDSDVDTEVVTGRGDDRNTVLTHKWIQDDGKRDTEMKVRENEKQTIGEEETGELVAGISLHRETGGDDHEVEKIPNQEIIKEKGKSNERESRVENEASYDEVPVLGSSLPPTTAGPQLVPSPAASVDGLTVVSQSPGHHTQRGEVAAVTSTGDGAMTNNLPIKPAQAELRTTHKAIKSMGKRRNETKTQKPVEKKKKKEVVMETGFHYFMDNYCPLECACYGRVVQCSDKGVDKVPYGIPYNARYILLMNNHINSIQLDLLSEYVSMEFLVLSNNQLTNGAIEGAFYGVPALKRLYLDRNLLESVPTDLPVCLEEIRLDDNRLSVMSQAAWTRCPGLQVLSLSNNSLGTGSEPFPNGVFSPLHQLRTLNLNHNRLTSVPLGLPLSIKELYLKGNLIEQFHGGVFNGLSELAVLDVSGNRLTDKGLLQNSLVNATHLESINFEGNSLKRIPRHLPLSLKTLNLEGNLIAAVKKAALRALTNLEHLGLARNRILKVSPGAFGALPALHQLDLSHNALHQVPRQLPPGLNSVALTHNKIRSVPRDAFCWGDGGLGVSGLVRVQLEHNFIDMGKLDAQAFRCLRGFQVVHFY